MIHGHYFQKQGVQLVYLEVKAKLGLEREPGIKVGSREQVADIMILLLILVVCFIDFNLNKLHVRNPPFYPLLI